MKCQNFKAMKIEHELFAHHYILTGDKEKAYQKAYPAATGEALKIAARRLINHSDVRAYISIQLRETQEKVVKQFHEEEQRRIDEEQASILLKRKMLHDMISGQLKRKRLVKVGDSVETMEEDISPMAMLRAIELDSKLANDWFNKDQQQQLQEPGKEERRIKELRSMYNLLQANAELVYGPDYMPGLRAKRIKHDPQSAREFKEQGLRILHYVPDAEDFERMKQEQEKKYNEWRELKKFAEEQLEETAYDTGEEDTECTEDIVLPSVPGKYPRAAKNITLPLPGSTGQKAHRQNNTQPQVHHQAARSDLAKTKT